MSVDFKAWPKIPRLASPFIVTEKIDGSNGTIVILEKFDHEEPEAGAVATVTGGLGYYEVHVQSRNRFITPEQDNFGFAGWVRENAEVLARELGVGYHAGEWWGHGIQRGYGLARGDRRFSLFNVTRHEGLSVPEVGLGAVPVLAASDGDRSVFDTSVAVDGALDDLRWLGSYAAPGFMNPEGIVLLHQRSRQVFKQYLDPAEKADEVSKREQELAA